MPPPRPVLPSLVLAVAQAPGADDPLEMRRRALVREMEQPLLGRRRRDPRHGADLRVRDPAPPQRVGDLRQRRQRMRDAHILPRGAGRQVRAPAQPLRVRRGAGPALQFVEAADPDQQFVDGGVDASGEFGDLIRQAVALVAAPVALVRVRHWRARR